MMCSILITIYNVTLWTCPNNIEPDVESSPVPSPVPSPAPSAAAPVPSPVPSPAPSPAPSLVAVIGVVAGDVVPSPAPSPVTDVVPSPALSPVTVIGDVVPSAAPSPVTVIGDVVPSVWTAPVSTDQLLLAPSPSVLVLNQTDVCRCNQDWQNQTDVCRCNQDWQHVLWILPVVILVAIVIFRKGTVNRIADTPPVRYLLRLRRARSWPSVSLRTVELPGRAQSEPIFDSIVV
jgi:hypothetical protein